MHEPQCDVFRWETTITLDNLAFRYHGLRILHIYMSFNYASARHTYVVVCSMDSFVHKNFRS